MMHRLLLLMVLAVGAGAAERSEPSLGARFADAFPIGMSVSGRVLRDPAAWALVRHHARVLTSENDMKPHRIMPTAGSATFARADRFMAASASAGLPVIGHTLVWHIQAPPWFFADIPDGSATAAVVLDRLRGYIGTVAGRYRGRIQAWDVVNEALADGPGDRFLRDSPWSRATGEAFLIEAFRAAAAADPGAKLLYNDYEIESEPKRSRVIRLVRLLRAAGCRIDGVGIQGHWTLEHPRIAVIDAAIKAFAAEGLEVHITELDVTVLPRHAEGGNLLAVATATDADDPFRAGLPPEIQGRLAERYRELFACFLANRKTIARVTFWNVHDGDSWLNNWPVQGRTDHPLLFDRNLLPKPAFQAVLDTLAAP